MLEKRQYIIVGMFVLVGLIYIGRLAFLQLIDDSYSLESSSNSIKRVIEVPYRGQIYDRSGKLMVHNTPVYDLYVTPKKVRIADTLAFCRLLAMTRPDFDSIMAVAKSYSPVKASLFLRQLTKEEYAGIQDAMVDYQGFEPRMSSTRAYEAHTLANALGYVSEISKKALDAQTYPYYRQGDYVGHNGLEQQYENVLRGRRGVRFVMQNVRGANKGSYKNGALDTLGVAGQNLYTSIDLDLQSYADSLMQHKVGSIIAIDPATGEILVSVSAPTYDPALLATRFFSKTYSQLVRNPYKPLINRPVMSSYRPGSTFKLIEALVAQQQGSLSEHTVYSHGGAPMRCHCRGSNSLRGAIGNSCNPYFYYVFRKLIYKNGDPNTFRASAIGLTWWHEQVSKFGIGQKLGIDLPSELRGNLPSVDDYDKVYGGENTWKFSNVASLAIGEGELLISPLKLVNTAAIIANRGYYIIPHYVKGISALNKNIPAQYLEKQTAGISAHYFPPVIEGMRMAVTQGTAKQANLPGIDMCGKSGTSQNAKFGHRSDHSIFVGFAPMNGPKIAIAVFVENAGWGGSVAAPIAALVAERFLKGKTISKSLSEKMRTANFMPSYQYMTPPAKRAAPPKPTPDTLPKPHRMVAVK